jgi:hypothetical protein
MTAGFMKRLLLVLTTFALVFSSGDAAFAQMNRKNIKKNNKRIASFRGKKSGFGKEKRYNAIGFSVNALNYYGDLAPRPSKISTDISFTRPGFGVSFAHRFGPRYTVQGQFMYGTLKGSDNESADKSDLDNGIYRYQRNLSFRNQIKELSVVAVFDLFENQSTYLSRAEWTPYAFLGAAVFLNDPKAQTPAGEWVKLRPLGTEGQYSDLLPTDANYGIKPYSGVQFAIPFGIGARLRLNEVFDFSADIAFRYTFTDYIDDVSKNYVDLGVLKSDLARQMSYRTNELGALSNPQPYTGRDGQMYTVQAGYGSEHIDNMRGSSNDRDIYMVTSFRISYIIGATLHRAKFR